MKDNYDFVKQKITLLMDRYGNDEITFDEAASERSAIIKQSTSAQMLGLLTSKELMDLIGYACEMQK